MSEIEHVESELVEIDEISHPPLADASTIKAAAWPLNEARYRISNFAAIYPGYQDELVRALGHIDIANGIMESLEHRTYGDYGHTA